MPASPKPRHAQLLAVADARRHLHRDALAVGHAALAFAFGAGVLDRRAGAVALLAGRGRLHVTQKRTLNTDDTALAAAFGAGDYLAVLAEARPLAIGAGCEAVVDDFLLDAACDLFKRDTQADPHVAAFLARGPSALAALAAEERRENVAHSAEAAAEQVVEVNVAGSSAISAARSAGDGPEAVVLRALIGVGENVVCLVKLLELVLSVGQLCSRRGAARVRGDETLS